MIAVYNPGGYIAIYDITLLIQQKTSYYITDKHSSNLFDNEMVQ